MALLEPLTSIIISFILLGVLLYKRVNLGITLNATALLMAALALDWIQIPRVVYDTSVDVLTVSTVLATFGIMLLSVLYKETGVINRLSKSIGCIIKNPKVVMVVLPAVIGLLPVAGGALMSAPLVDTEAEKLKLKPDKKAYINLWFRHTIFPVYPLSPPIIVTVALTGIVLPAIILRQIPVVIVMVIVGYFIGLWKITTGKNKKDAVEPRKNGSDGKEFLVAFSPLLVTIIVGIALSSVISAPSQQGFDVLIATLVGLAVLIGISKLNFRTFAKPFKTWGIYGVTLATYGAFLLRKTVEQPAIRQLFQGFVSGGTVDIVLLLILVPAFLGVVTGSPVSGVAISVPIFAGIFATFTAKVAALIYISAYLGYTVAPTHLCFTFTADYFKCPLGKMYKYVIPSFLITFAAAILVYFLL